MFFRDQAGATVDATINFNLYDNSWHHVVIVVSASNALTVYVDKVSRTVTYGTQSTLAAFADFTFPVFVAARNNRATPDQHFTGSLALVAAYKSRLDLTAATAHYDAL